MASGKSATRRNDVLDWLLGGATPTRPTTRKLSFLSVAPSASSAGTEISGTGYTAGGESIAYGAAASGAATGPSSGTIQLTNGSGTTWSIVGATTHSAASGAPAASDVIYWIDGLSISVPDGNVLEIQTNGVSWSES